MTVKKSEVIEAMALAIANVIGQKPGNILYDWITPARLQEAEAAYDAFLAIVVKASNKAE